ncbi:hypothetical protein V6N11_004868 [Hibiscus sabdariffa]|uniref:Uncharacterized protein n=1 Tax=Hibiscus sabdariffa TaxID=183260 RepID=A0ABR2SI39_9ROSI
MSPKSNYGRIELDGLKARVPDSRDQVVLALNLTPKHNAVVAAFQRGNMVADKLVGRASTSHSDLVQFEIPPRDRVSPLLLIDKLHS